MKHIAIVGAGPRGLSALESLFHVLAMQSDVAVPKVTLFDTARFLGAGQIWDIDQQDINWLNVSTRTLISLEGRDEAVFKGIILPSFPDFNDWLLSKGFNISEYVADAYLPRSVLGQYLNERFITFTKPLLHAGHISIVTSLVVGVEYEDNRFKVLDDKKETYLFDEVLLAIGHQPTKLSKELTEWEKHAEETDTLELFLKAYPTDHISNSQKINSETVVAIRGFGLAMLDDVRALTISRGGVFKIIDSSTFQSEFQTSARVPQKIVPFSLEGKPPIPKPLNKKIDDLFSPNQYQLELFSNKIAPYTSGKKQTDTIYFLKQAVAAVAAEQYKKLGNRVLYQFEKDTDCVEIIMSWLDNEDFEHRSIYPQKESTHIAIEAFVKMAVTGENIALDYCIGQVWRHCQYILYSLFSHAKLPDDVITATVELTVRMHRYAAGPPVESMQQVLALYRAGILTFDFCNNPEIKLTSKGWLLSSEKREIQAHCMVNSVLSAPKLLKVTSPLIKKLLSGGMLKPVHSELGIETREDATIILPDKDSFIPLSVLGRLCKGSILGTDSILECFNNEAKDWALGVAERNKE